MPDDSGGSVAQQGRQDLEEMWTALLACDWSSLAVVPTDHTVLLKQVVAVLHSRLGDSDPPISVIDARGVNVAEGKQLTGKLASAISGRGRVVVVVDPLTSSLSGVHLVESVTAVLLVVRIGAMDLDSLTSTVAIVGPDRIVGSVTASDFG
jgi:hypothetical protein